MAQIYRLKEQTKVELKSIVSKRLIQGEHAHADIYAMDAGEELDREMLFGDSLVWAVEGEISLEIEGRKFTLKGGDAIVVNKGEWRKFVALAQSKLILITLKENIMIDHLDKSAIFALTDAVEYQTGKIVSKTLVKNERGTVTLMSFDGAQELSTHAAPGDALLIALDGTLDLTIGNERFDIKAGDSIVMPGKIPHGLVIKDKFKMLLIVTRD